jgi:hypothetical protein
VGPKRDTLPVGPRRVGVRSTRPDQDGILSMRNAGLRAADFVDQPPQTYNVDRLFERGVVDSIKKLARLEREGSTRVGASLAVRAGDC